MKRFFTENITRTVAIFLIAFLLICIGCSLAITFTQSADNNATSSITAQSEDSASDTTDADSTTDTDTAELTRYSTVIYGYFDTVTTIIAYCESEEEFDAQIEAIEADLAYYNELYDIYNTYDGVNNLATLNEIAADAPVEVDEEIINLLLEAKEMYALTDGNVNVAMGTVFALWHDEREIATYDPDAAKLPDEDALLAAAEHTDLDDVILDTENNTVYFADAELQLDVGSCGKGYACEMIAQNAEARGVTSMLMSIGGNLRGIGTKPDGSTWVAGVEDPWAMAEGETVSLVSIQLTDLSLVVSGDYQRYYYVDGEKYHHLIDPDTLYPADYFNSVSVLTEDAGLADCLSTALFCMSLEDGQALVESIDELEAMWCLTDGETVVYSSGFLDHQN